MPDLQKLYDEGISFSDNDKMGGPEQTYGSSWSVASMVNMSMGLPLKVPMNGNSYGKSGYFLPGAVSIGDVLHDEGYNQTIMFGADADFGG
ncbi:MAG: LTA synthase family protein, partial [Vagococcus sp.]